MRRAVAALIGAMLILSLGTASVEAVKPKHERYQAHWANAFWHVRNRVDANTYLRTTWYVGVYETEERGFYSDLYRSVERCEKRAGRDRCRYLRGLSWYGHTKRLGRGSFSLDRRLTAAHLDATYKLYRYTHHDRVFVGRARIVTDLTGSGRLTHGRNSYTSHEGCTVFTYSGKWEQREATATGMLTMGRRAALDLGETSHASMGASTNADFKHKC
jgi:hypothetical protein